MPIPRHSLPLMIDVEGHPYLIEPGEVDFLPSGVPVAENIYPQLSPSWEAPGPVVTVEDGETLDIMGRRFMVNLVGDVELVALALPGESEFEGDESAAYERYLSSIGSHIDGAEAGASALGAKPRRLMWEHDGSTPDERAEREAGPWRCCACGSITTDAAGVSRPCPCDD